MKISKSKQELARIISENGGWRDGATWAIQHGTDRVAFTGRKSKPSWDKSCCCWGGYDFFGGFTHPKIYNYHQTILSREEYFHLYPSPDADGWIEWNGGECPVGEGDLIDVKLSDGDEFFDVDSDWDWGVDAGGCNIIAYRLHKPEQAKPEYCESVMRSIPEPEINSKNIDITQVGDIGVVESKPTIEQLAADYRNAKDCAERKQQEADEAKAVVEAKLKALELAGEAIGLLLSPINAKKEPELVIAVQAGDEVECVESNIKRDKYNGMVGRLRTIDDTSTPYLVDFGGEEKIWCHKVKFISRP